MNTRRGFLGAMLAACAAPAYVKAGILMPVRQIASVSDAIWTPATLKLGNKFTIAGVNMKFTVTHIDDEFVRGAAKRFSDSVDEEVYRSIIAAQR